jgi:hypothetical protein
MPKTIPEQLDGYGCLLHSLLVELPDHPATTDTLDYALGALYGLTQANQTGFKDRPTQYLRVYRPHLANYALQVASGLPLHSLWTAGFYFNSGIQRIASAFDRIPRMLGAKMHKQVAGRRQSTTAKERMKEVNAKTYTQWERVYDEINAFKHSPEGRAAGRKVTINDALSAFGEMMQLISDKKAILLKRYGP